MELNTDKPSEVFEVEKIVSKIIIDEKVYYFIKYVGYDQLVCYNLFRNKLLISKFILTKKCFT